MNKKPLIGPMTFVFATSAFAQGTPPKVETKPLVQVKPKAAATGCKLDLGCDRADAQGLRGATPAAEAAPPLPDQATGFVRTAQRQ